VSEDEFQDTYSDIELDEEATRLLDQDLDDFEAPRPLDSFEFGSEDYCKNYRKSLAIETKARTNLDPFDWQLDVAVNTHLGWDVFSPGLTLVLVMPAFLSSNLTLFLVSPLNALANAQVKEFDRWKLKAVAVNATTKYKDLKKDILAGKFQIIISSIEAFTDTTHVLPIVKSPELAALSLQCFIIDEVHCIPKCGQHFCPQYTIVGTLRLLLTREVPMVAATATANNLM
ncbi:ATP-dependent DNA helicase sgs1, partial [Ceratobasidium sp. 423]